MSTKFQKEEETWITSISLKERHKDPVRGDGYFNLSEFVREKLDEEFIND